MLYLELKEETGYLDESHMLSAFRDTLVNHFPKEKHPKVMVIPPDITRFHSRAGQLTKEAYDYYRENLKDILPALGTHRPMTDSSLEKMFPGVPKELFRIHNWKKDLISLGEVPTRFMEEVSGGRLSGSWPVKINKSIARGGHSLLLSVGQVVPHEIVGMANYNKNIFIGTGGSEAIHQSHFLGAVHGMEKIMGRVDTPVRRVLNYASKHFTAHLPILYVLTVVAPDPLGIPRLKGLFIGDDQECFQKAAELSRKVNFISVASPLKRVVAYLDPKEFTSTWLGNKAIYRTRMALADQGELIILAPGLREFGEDKVIDQLIRKYGYKGTEVTLASVKANKDLQNNLSAAAHLIHGSSEGRFKITYCPGYLSKEEIESAGYSYGSLQDYQDLFRIDIQKDGPCTDKEGNPFYFIRNPALGLWAHSSRLH